MKNFNKFQSRDKNQILKNCRLSIVLVCLLAISEITHAQWSRTSPNVYLTTGTDKVGVGTTTPETKFHISDQTPVSSFTGINNAGLRIHSANTATSNYALIGFSGYNTAYTRNLAQIGANFTGSGSSLYFGTSNNYNSGITNTAMTISYNGNVGVGTTTPVNKLEVRDGGGLTITNTTTSAVLTINRANSVAGSSSQISFQDNSTTKWAVGGTNIGSAGANNLSFYNYTLGANALTISNSNNNVGIGTTSPGSRLTVAAGYDGDGISVIGSSYGPKDAAFRLGDDLGHYGSLGLASANNAFMSGVASGDIILTNASGKVHIGSGSASAFPTMTVAGGSVGIGTTSPGYILDVAGRMRIRSGGFTAGTWFMNTANTVDAGFVGMLNDNYIGLYGTGIGWGLVMNTTTGNVGMGTFTPAYKLDVCGTIRSKEVRVETGWCDYVFDKDYKLPALTEVESFIKENKHLPGVTKGSEIETEGLEVGKVSAQMIKKIEELTLYIIALQKEVDVLKNRK